MEYRNIIKYPYTRATWTRSAANEFGRLMEGLKRGITGTQAMKMVYRRNIPKERKVTYAGLYATIYYRRKRPIDSISK